MAKVAGALYSISASGKFGEVVFDKRGYARPRIVPHNPKTAAQGNHRQVMKAVHRGISVLGKEVRNLLKDNVTLKGFIGSSFNSSYWSGYFVKVILGEKKVDFWATLSVFNNLNESAQVRWEEYGIGLGLEVAKVEYATDAGVSAGEQLFLVARGLYKLGLYTNYGVPSHSNAAKWARAISGKTEIVKAPPSTSSITPSKNTIISLKQPITINITSELDKLQSLQIWLLQTICLWVFYTLIRFGSFVPSQKITKLCVRNKPTSFINSEASSLNVPQFWEVTIQYYRRVKIDNKL